MSAANATTTTELGGPGDSPATATRFDYEGNSVVIIASIFLSLTWITNFIRLYSRWLKWQTPCRKIGCHRFGCCSFGWDDLLMILTNAILTLYISFALTVTLDSRGQSFTTLSYMALNSLLAYTVAALCSYVATMIVFKIGLALFYLRTLVLPWQRRILFISIGINTLYNTGFFFVALFICGNPAHFLSNTLKGECIANRTLYPINLTAGVINAITDWIMALLPVITIVRSSMRLFTKLSLATILFLGVAGSVISIVRLFYIQGLAQGSEFFSTASLPTIFSIVEPGIGLTAAALATYKPLCEKLITRAESLSSEGASGRKEGKRGANVSVASCRDPMEAFEAQLQAHERAHREVMARAQAEGQVGDGVRP